MRFVLVALLLAGSADAAVSWRTLQTGVEYATTGTLHVVRIDPARAKVQVALASELGVAPRTASEWCSTQKLAVAINLGMFQTDHRSNVGYLRHGKHVNHRRWNSYRSALAVNPSDASLPPALWVDLDQSKPMEKLAKYDIVVQNLRLIAGNRRNVWAKSDKKWSEAALAIDSRGRLLFVFTRAPYTMRRFNELLLSLPLDITQAMHLEGGPEASLSIHTRGFDLDLSGSYETGFLPDDSNEMQWPIPNVIGVVRE